MSMTGQVFAMPAGRHVRAVIDELLSSQEANLDHWLIGVDAAAAILEATGADGAAEHLLSVAEEIRRERGEARMRAFEESERRSYEQRARERARIKQVPCPWCGAPVGRMCKTPSGSRADELHRDRRQEADRIAADS